MNNEPIKVLLVDDSPVVLIMLTRILATTETGIKVIGTARHGVEALRKIPELNPHVICTDLQMPIMDGLELTRNIMARCPLPILVLSAVVEQGVNDDNIFKLLEAGAVEIIPKPRGSLDGDLSKIGRELISKIKILAGVKAFTRHQPPVVPKIPDRPNIPPPPVSRLEPLLARCQLPPPVISKNEAAETIIPKTTQVVAIGASTGGPQALQKILAGLPAKLSIPVVCIQHVSEGFTDFLVDWLGVNCPLPVRTARLGEPLLPGTVYFPPVLILS